MSTSPAALPDVVREVERVSADVVRRASEYPSSILADVAGRRGALSGRIAPLAATMRFAGPALTVEVRPGDNLMIHAALAIAKAGDVIVVDGKGDLGAALMGEIMCQQAVASGVVAVVIDGAVRDAEAIRALGLPMYAAGLNPNGPTKFVPGRINHPISIGGVSVQPGDLVVGDGDGVVIVPRWRIAEAAAELAAIRDKESGMDALVKSGATSPSWLAARLTGDGVRYVED
jgi:4-hydroxy-4-methyl-2-oxoglutarate aldolase